MTNQINDFIKNETATEFATNAGRAMHVKLQHVRIGAIPVGDAELIAKIEKNETLKSFFGENSRAEVPIAGIINGHFVSRRIDRLVVDDAAKTVRVLDYKTDVDTEKFRPKYIAQIKEYIELLKQIYSGYKISGAILWLRNWTIENI